MCQREHLELSNYSFRLKINQACSTPSKNDLKDHDEATYCSAGFFDTGAILELCYAVHKARKHAMTTRNYEDDRSRSLQ